jgi:hypothetical protein
MVCDGDRGGKRGSIILSSGLAGRRRSDVLSGRLFETWNKGQPGVAGVDEKSDTLTAGISIVFNGREFDPSFVQKIELLADIR